MSQSTLPAIPKNMLRDSLLEERFSALWRRCLNPGAGAADDAAQVWSKIARHYSEPHRHYHDRQHLAHCLQQLDMAGDQVSEPQQVEMAIWFHDIINDPGDPANEQRSADYFRSLAAPHMDRWFVDAVIELILVTTHKTTPRDRDQQFICDIDLASFGCPWECFLRDTNAVKAEFQGTEEEYYRGKKGFLNSMLQRPKIFLTDFFNTRYEQQARDNIQRLLEMIDDHQGT